MEMNQKLFDECSQKYKAERQREKERVRERDDLWNKIEHCAKKNPKVLEKVLLSFHYHHSFFD